MTRSKFIQQALFWAGILVAVSVSWWIVRHYQITELWIRAAGPIGPLVAILLYGLLSLTPIPSDPLTILSGAIYGWAWGFFISWFGNTLAAMVEYMIFRDIRQITQFETTQAKIPDWLKKWPVHSPIFLIGGRLIPGIGGKMVSIMAGIYKVSWWRFLWTTMAANLVGSLIWILSGWGLVKLF